MTAEAYWVNQTNFWGPDPADPARITRFGRVQDVRDGLSETPHVTVNQARLGDFLLEFARNSPSRACDPTTVTKPLRSKSPNPTTNRSW
jgi:phenol 2-monooxygenase (NADPH)